MVQPVSRGFLTLARILIAGGIRAEPLMLDRLILFARQGILNNIPHPGARRDILENLLSYCLGN